MDRTQEWQETQAAIQSALAIRRTPDTDQRMIRRVLAITIGIYALPHWRGAVFEAPSSMREREQDAPSPAYWLSLHGQQLFQEIIRALEQMIEGKSPSPSETDHALSLLQRVGASALYGEFLPSDRYFTRIESYKICASSWGRSSQPIIGLLARMVQMAQQVNKEPTSSAAQRTFREEEIVMASGTILKILGQMVMSDTYGWDTHEWHVALRNMCCLVQTVQ